MINALNSGAKVFMADLEDANSPTWDERDRGPGQPRRRGARNDRVDTPTRRPTGCGPRTSSRRWSCGRAAGTWSRSTSPSTASRSPPACSTSACTSSTTAGRALERGFGPYFYLPKLESHLEARLWNEVMVGGRGRPRSGPRHDPRDRADRDDHRRVRDGRDPLRAARAHLRPQRRPLGLHLQRRQALPHRPRLRAAGPRAGDDDHAVHAGLQRAPGQDLPQARGPRHRRHGRVHPQPPQARGDRGGPGQGPRGQAPRGRRRLRRDLGGPPRPGSDAHGRVRRRARLAHPTSSTRQRPDVDVQAADLLAVEPPEGGITDGGAARPTSTSASATWPPGSPAPGLPRSTT